MGCRIFIKTLHEKSGIDDYMIGQGVTMMQTFTNVANAGKGVNAVFDRANSAALDLSAKGFGDVASTSKMLGKALNDPVKGISAMSRAGVTFTEGQKKTIKAMVKSGNLLGAQKTILAEVERQVGGAAKAYGSTMPGMVGKLKESFSGLAAEVLSQLMPALMKGMQFAQKMMKAFSQLSPNTKKLIAIFAALAAALGPVLMVVGMLMTAWPALAAAFAVITGPVGLVIAAIVGLGLAFMIAWRNSETFRSLIKNTMKEIAATVKVVVAFIKKAWQTLMPPIIAWMKKHGADLLRVIMLPMRMLLTSIRVVMAILRGDWQQAWTLIKNFVGSTLRAMWNTAKAALGLFVSAAVAIGRGFLRGLRSGIAAAPGVMANIVRGILSAASSLPGRLGSVGRTAGSALANGIRSMVNGVINAWNGLEFKVPAMKVKGVTVFPGASVGTPNIPNLATGGVATRPTLARIGEAGAEAVVPLRRLRAMTGGGNGSSITVNVNVGGSNASPHDIGTAVVSALRKAGIRP